jgi:hypothetical protein
MSDSSSMANHIKLGAYFYPITTSCPIRATRAQAHGVKLVNEAFLASKGKPLFEGHDQPRVSCLGNRKNWIWDDADPKAMELQVDIALEYGIDFWVFATYIGTKRGTPYFEMAAPLEKAFLGSGYCRNLEFAIMATLASPRAVLPLEPGYIENDRSYDTNEETARLIIDICAEKYWKQPNYFYIKGRPYLSVFTGDAFLRDLFSIRNNCQKFFSSIKEYAWHKYKTDPYLVGIVRAGISAELLVASGVDALTGYALLPDWSSTAVPLQRYWRAFREREIEWPELRKMCVFVPSVSTGWDASSRVQHKSAKQIFHDVGKFIDAGNSVYPLTPIIYENSAEVFESALRRTYSFVEKEIPLDEQYMLIFAWNEVTETPTLLPRIMEDRIDFSYLEAVKRLKNTVTNSKIIL